MDRALLARVEKQAWFHRYPRGWPLLLFLLVPAVIWDRDGRGLHDRARGTAVIRA